MSYVAVAARERDKYGRELYPVKCARCQADTKVPFEPNPARKVYCGDCYHVIRNAGRTTSDS